MGEGGGTANVLWGVLPREYSLEVSLLALLNTVSISFEKKNIFLSS